MNGTTGPAVQTDESFRNGPLEIANHHAAGGNATYVYQFDYHPVEDELPFLFGTFDAYPDSPMLGKPGDAQRARTFASAVAEFITTGSVNDCHLPVRLTGS